MVEKPIPYKPEDTKWPKIDFEVAETEYEFPNKWGTTDRKKVKHHSSKKETNKITAKVINITSTIKAKSNQGRSKKAQYRYSKQ